MLSLMTGWSFMPDGLAGLQTPENNSVPMAEQMDFGGPDWVRQNREYVVQRTVSNAKNNVHRLLVFRS